MKHLKASGLVAMAAMALMAILGAGSASATTICTQTETPCAAGNQYTTTQDNIIEASLETGSTATWKGTGGTVEDTCTSSGIKGEITNAGSSTTTVKIKVTETTFGGCKDPTSANNAATCTIEVHNIVNTDNGTPTASGCTLTILEGGGTVTCRYGYGNETHLGILTGGAMGTIDINAVLVKIDTSSFLCPETEVLEAKYTMTKPTDALYVEP
ncbi:MAG: hypothetical protein ACTHNP_09475 [Solirubrobacterales bacterium]